VNEERVPGGDAVHQRDLHGAALTVRVLAQGEAALLVELDDLHRDALVRAGDAVVVAVLLRRVSLPRVRERTRPSDVTIE